MYKNICNYGKYNYGKLHLNKNVFNLDSKEKRLDLEEEKRSRQSGLRKYALMKTTNCTLYYNFFQKT